jgi:hypothetical protein
MYWISKQYRFPELPPFKDFRLLKTYTKQSDSEYNLTVEVRKDYEDTGSSYNITLAGSGAEWDTAVWDADEYAGESIVTGRIEPYIEGAFFQIKFSNSGVDQPIEQRGHQIFVEGQDRY